MQTTPDADYTDFAHTGPGTLAGRYLRSFWQPVARAQDVPAGRARPIKVMSEDFTLYRGEAGAAHVLAFRCAHRGTQLSTGWVEGDCVRCFYHGWTYDQNGQCVEAPAEREGFAETVQIRAYPTQEYLGLIFAYLGEGEGEPPPLPRYAEFEGEGILDPAQPVVWPCNYFNRLENSPDTVHLAFVHRDSPFSENGLVDIPTVSGRETDYGLEIRSERPGGVVRTTHFHMPNVNLIKGSPEEVGGPWTEHMSWRVPVDDEHCASYIAAFTHLPADAIDDYVAQRRAKLARAPKGVPASVLAEAVLRGEIRIADITEPTSIVNVQDYVAQVGQGTIAPRERDRLGRSDAAVIQMRRIWARELEALAEGLPLKQWHRTGRVELTVGV